MQPATRSLLRFHESTLRLAQQHGNAVLGVIEPDSFSEDVKYPAGHLQFGGQGWQAYYHTHASPWRNAREHGHFHLFCRSSRAESDDWAHVVCLGVDAMGQALEWSLVNQWVTGGEWLTANELEVVLNHIEELDSGQFASMQPVEGWLLSLLGISREEIVQLYGQRDLALEKLQASTDVRRNRDVYGLARCSINLPEKLRGMLAASSPTG